MKVVHSLSDCGCCHQIDGPIGIVTIREEIQFGAQCADHIAEGRMWASVYMNVILQSLPPTISN